jgi:hypothetical protein
VDSTDTIEAAEQTLVRARSNSAGSVEQFKVSASADPANRTGSTIVNSGGPSSNGQYSATNASACGNNSHHHQLPWGGMELTSTQVKLLQKRKNVWQELISTERLYVQDLRIIQNVFLLPIRQQKLLNPYEIVSLFSNVEQLLVLNQV